MKGNGRNILIFIGIVILSYLLYFFRSTVSYILVAWVLSLIAMPLVAFYRRILSFKKFKPGNGLLALLTMISFLAVIILLLWLFIPLVLSQANNLSKVNLDALNQTLHIPLDHLRDWLVKYRMLDAGVNIDTQLAENIKALIEPSKIGLFFSSAVEAAGNLLFSITSVMFILFFFLKDQNSFDDFLKSLVPERYESHLMKALNNITKMLRSYFTGILTQVTILTILLTIALSLFGLKNVLLIAFFGALMNVIPYLGIIIAMLFGVMITISSNLDLDFYTQITPMIFKVLITFASVQLIDNILVQPLVYSNSVKAHPLEIFLVIMMAGKIGGVAAMLIAIPVYTSFKVIAKVFFNQWRVVQHMTKSMSDLE